MRHTVDSQMVGRHAVLVPAAPGGVVCECLCVCLGSTRTARIYCDLKLKGEESVEYGSETVNLNTLGAYVLITI